MTGSRALFVATNAGDGTRVARAAATAPQRWAIARRAADGWLEATHQLLGDGVFGGETHRARIEARAGSRVAIRAVAATPLRGANPSATVTHLRAESGARLLHLPGALIPHRGADHRNVLRIDSAADACLLAVSLVVPGRVGMAERNAFCRLQLRTVVRVGGVLALAEDVVVEPWRFAIDGPAGFAGDGVSISVVALGPWAVAEPAWWDVWRDMPGVAGGAGRLRAGGVVFRGLCSNLGVATALVGEMAQRARHGL